LGFPGYIKLKSAVAATPPLHFFPLSLSDQSSFRSQRSDERNLSVFTSSSAVGLGWVKNDAFSSPELPFF